MFLARSKPCMQGKILAGIESVGAEEETRAKVYLWTAAHGPIVSGGQRDCGSIDVTPEAKPCVFRIGK